MGKEFVTMAESETSERRSRKSVAFTDEQLVVDADGSVSVMSAPEDPKDSAQSHTSPDPTTEAPPADDGLDLSLMKKKKKKKKAKDAGAEDDEFTAKLKQLEVKDDEPQAEEVETGDMDAGTGTWAHDETKIISYPPLLERFFAQLSQKNPDHALSGTKSYKIPPPQCMREGNRKTV